MIASRSDRRDIAARVRLTTREAMGLLLLLSIVLAIGCAAAVGTSMLTVRAAEQH